MNANLHPNAATDAVRRSKGFGLVEIVVVILILGVLAAFLLPSVRRSREPARRSQCKNNLKQIVIALQNYVDVHHALPPAYTVDADGKPLHSWRTLILPYLEQKALYDKIDLTKAWDDPANAEVFKSFVWAYACPSEALGESRNLTTYLAVVTPTSCMRLTEPRLLADIKDGTSKTVMVLEVDSKHAVPWMAPQDADEALFLGINPQSDLVHAGGTHAAMVDGSARFLNANLPIETRRALISIDGNEPDEF